MSVKKNIPKKLREEILNRDFYTCQACGMYHETSRGLEIHHVLPEYLGGPTTLDNLITLCFVCHYSAPDKPEEFETYKMLGGAKLGIIAMTSLVKFDIEKLQQLNAFQVINIITDIQLQRFENAQKEFAKFKRIQTKKQKKKIVKIKPRKERIDRVLYRRKHFRKPKNQAQVNFQPAV